MTCLLFASESGWNLLHDLYFYTSPPFNGPHLNAPQSDIFVSLQVSYDIGVNILAFIPTVILGIIGGLLGAVFTFIYLKVQYVCMIMIGC